jgi:hypothetical protein
MGFRKIWRRMKGSLGSVRDGLRGRGASALDELLRLSQVRGGRSDERRMGGSASWVDKEWRVFRMGDTEVGVVVPDVDSL